MSVRFAMPLKRKEIFSLSPLILVRKEYFLDRVVPIEKIFDTEEDCSKFIEKYFYTTSSSKDLSFYTPSRRNPGMLEILSGNYHCIEGTLSDLCLACQCNNKILHFIKFHHDDMLFSISSEYIYDQIPNKDMAQRFFREEYRKAPENRRFKDYPLKKHIYIAYTGEILLYNLNIPIYPEARIEITFGSKETIELLKLFTLFTDFAVRAPSPHLPEPNHPKIPPEENITNRPKQPVDPNKDALPNEPINKKGDSTMSNPLNFGITPIKDENINGTLLGIAVRTPDGG